MLAHFNTLEPFQDQVPRSIANFLFLSRSCGRVGCSRHVKYLALGKRERVNRCRVWGRPMSWGIDLMEMVLSCQRLKANQLCSPYRNFFFLKLSPYISLTSPVLITLLSCTLWMLSKQVRRTASQFTCSLEIKSDYNQESRGALTVAACLSAGLGPDQVVCESFLGTRLCISPS